MKIAQVFFKAFLFASISCFAAAQETYSSPCGFSFTYPAGAEIASTPADPNQCQTTLAYSNTRVALTLLRNSGSLDEVLTEAEVSSSQQMIAGGGRLRSRSSPEPSIIGSLSGKSITLDFVKGTKLGSTVYAAVYAVNLGQNLVVIVNSPTGEMWNATTLRRSIGSSLRFKAGVLVQQTPSLVGNWFSNAINQRSVNGAVLPLRTFTASIVFGADGGYGYSVSQSAGDPWMFTVGGTYSISSSPTGKAILTLAPTRIVSPISPLEKDRVTHEGFPGASQEDFILEMQGNSIEMERYYGGSASGISVSFRRSGR